MWLLAASSSRGGVTGEGQHVSVLSKLHRIRKVPRPEGSGEERESAFISKSSRRDTLTLCVMSHPRHKSLATVHRVDGTGQRSLLRPKQVVRAGDWARLEESRRVVPA